MKTKKIIACLLAVCMVAVLLAGCSKGGKQKDDENAIVYVPTYNDIDFGTEIYSIYNVCGSNGLIYLIANVVTDKIPHNEGDYSWEETVTEQRIFTIDASTYETSMLPDYSPIASSYDTIDLETGTISYQYISGFAAAEDGTLYVLLSTSINMFDLPDDYDPEVGDYWSYYTDSSSKYELLHLSEAGSELSRTELSVDSDDQYQDFSNMQITKNGLICVVYNWSALCFFDAEGKFIKKLDFENGGFSGNLVALADGSLATNFWDENGQAIKLIDTETFEFGDTLPISASNANYFYSGNDNYSIFYSNGNSVFGYNKDNETSEKLFSFLSCDVNSDYLSYTSILDDNSAICLVTEWNNDYSSQKVQLLTLTPTKSSEVPQKETITLATMYLDYSLKGNIIDFNRSNDKYRIELKDYSEYNTEDDYTAGSTKLATEIISGLVPDILYANGLPIKQYAAKGLLEDLWPYIESDPDLGKDRVVEPFFKALELDGKLYEVCSSFGVSTAIGLSRIVGTEPGWTFAEMQEAFSKLPEGATIFTMDYTRDDIMNMCIANNIESFVDWSTGNCSFNSEEFIGLLEFANSFPETFDYENFNWEDYVDSRTGITTGQQLIAPFYIYSILDSYSELMQYGEDVTAIGYPSSNGNGTYFNKYGGSFSMSTKCQNKEGAWEFIRTFLSEEYQEDRIWNGIPTNKAVYDSLIEEAMTPEYSEDINGETIEIPKYSYWTDNGTPEGQIVEIYALSEEEVSKITDIIESTTRVSSSDDKIMEIITDECSAFFDGQRSAKETADMIQSRVKIYVNEQL